MALLLELLIVAFLTVLIETPIMLLGMVGKIRKLGFLRIVLNSVLVNLITNLTLNAILLVNSYFGYPSGRMVLTMILEVVVLVAEGAMYCFAFGEKISKIRVCCVTLVANAVSFIVGLLIF